MYLPCSNFTYKAGDIPNLSDTFPIGSIPVFHETYSFLSLRPLLQNRLIRLRLEKIQPKTSRVGKYSSYQKGT